MKPLVAVLFVLLLSGCGWFFGPSGLILKDKSRAYTEEAVLPRMEMPADSRFSVEDAYPIARVDDRLAPTREKFVVPKPPNYLPQDAEDRDVMSGGLSAERVSMERDGNGFPILALDMQFQEAWVVVGEALGKADITVSDRNRELAIYYLTGVGERRKLRQREYHLKLNYSANAVLLSLQEDAETMAPADLAEAVLGQIRDAMLP